MNREILFRGQIRKNGGNAAIGTWGKFSGQWVYGGIFPCTGSLSIIYGWESEKERAACDIKKWTVYSDTVGQYTGLTDKNGVRIFEGDIVRYIDPDTQEYDIGEKYVADWDEEEACILFECFVYGESISYEVFNKRQAKNLEVIGNIFDNPELLKEASNGQTNHP